MISRSLFSGRHKALGLTLTLVAALVAGCITSIDNVTITGLFADADGTQSVPAGDASGLVFIGYHVDFSYNPNFGEADPPHPEQRIGVAFRLVQPDGQEPSIGGAFDTSLFADGDYAIIGRAFATGLFDTSDVRDSGPFPITIRNDGRQTDSPKDQNGDPHAKDASDPDGLDPNQLREGLSEAFEADPVNVVTGALYVPVEDASLPARGHTIKLSRYFNSRDVAHKAFGRGWSHLYERTVRLNDAGTLVETDGTGVRALFPRNAFGGFGAPRTYEGRVVLAGAELIIVHARGTRYVYETPDVGTVGKLLRIVDVYGNAVSFDYALGGALRGIVDPSGRRIEITMTSGRIDAAVLPNGEQWAYAYDADGRLISVTDPRGNVTHYTYDGAHRLASATSARGITTTYSYGDGGRVATVREANGAETSFTYNRAARQTTVRNQTGHSKVFQFDSEGNITSITDALGGVDRREYDSANRLVAVIDARGGTRRFTYDAFGNVTSETDALGFTSNVSYDSLLALPTRVVGPRGDTTTFEYDLAGSLLSVTDATGSESRYTYDNQGQLLSVRDQDGAVTAFAYDATGNVTKTTEPDGTFSTVEYDAVGRPVRMVDALGRVDRVTYHLGDKPATHTDALGRVTRFEYDADLNLTKVIEPSGAEQTFTYEQIGFEARVVGFKNPLGHQTSFGYDLAGRLTRTLDPLGRQTTLSYDPKGQMVQIVDPAGRTYGAGYDAAGNLTRTVDPIGTATEFVFDIEGNLTQVSRAGLARASIAFDANKNITSVTDGLGAVTSFVYDLDDQRTAQIDALGRNTLFDYSPGGNLLRSVDANGGITTFTFDIRSRLTQATDPAGNRSRWEYDAEDNVTAYVDANGNRTTSLYDAADRLVSETDALGGVTRYGYDVSDNIVSYTDANNHTTQFGYDLLSRQISETDPLGHTATYVYDAGDRVVQITHEDGRISTLTYDPADHLLSRTTPGDPSSDVVLTYDQKGNLATAARDGTVYQYTYDPLDQLLQRSGTLAGRVTDFQAWSYDVAGNVTSYTDPSGLVSRYTYNRLGQVVRLETVSDASSRAPPLVFDFEYDVVGRLTRRSYPNGTAVALGYNAANRVTALSVRAGTSLLAEKQYTYDRAGNVVQVRNESGSVEAYTYDAINRLTRAVTPHRIKQSGAKTPSTYQWVYDAVGNRLSETIDGVGVPSSFDAANQIVSTGSTQFVHDAAGNLIRRTTGDDRLELSYTVDGQVRTARTFSRSRETAAKTYSYDPLSERVAIDDGRSVELLSRNDGEIVQSSVVSPTGRIQSLQRFLRDPAGAILTHADPSNGSGLLHYYQDLQGSTMALASADGRLKSRLDYLPFGQLAAAKERLTSFLFGGLKLDELTGFLQATARDLDPSSGRWSSREPLGLAVGANLYAYAYNSPLTFVDRDGQLGLLAVSLINALVNAGFQYFETGELPSLWDFAKDVILNALPGPLQTLRNLYDLYNTALDLWSAIQEFINNPAKSAVKNLKQSLKNRLRNMLRNRLFKSKGGSGTSNLTKTTKVVNNRKSKRSPKDKHHIVPRKDARTPAFDEARKKLRRHRVNLEDKANKVKIYRKFHKKIHEDAATRDRYGRALTEALGRASTKKEVQRELRRFGDQLRDPNSRVRRFIDP